MLHLDAEAETIVRFELESAFEIVALPRQGGGIVHSPSLGIILPIRIEAPAVVQAEAAFLQRGGCSPKAVGSPAIVGR